MTDGTAGTAPADDSLVLGPLLRYVDQTSAAIWVEVARRGVVTARVDGRVCSAPTFTVHDHHYALVEVDDLQPGSSLIYQLEFEGALVWPEPGSEHPPSRIRTPDATGAHRILFGSCRTSVPHDAQHNRTHGIDVLRTYALNLPRMPARAWPHLVLFLGDQVYADETSDAMQRFITARRDVTQPPYTELRDYEEYAHLYRLAWTEPANRWLLSTLPSAMMFDDHDVRDDWNTSAHWREQINRTSWWRPRVIGAIASYWVYQHLGNLSPAERETDELWADVRRVGAEGDAGDLLDRFADEADRDPARNRWSFHRDLGGSRLVVLDTRAGRMLEPGDRRMVDDHEMAWFESLATGDVDHLLIGSSLPFLLPMGLHHLEAWNEAVSDGAWGPRAARFGERLRQTVDLEHWAAFQLSFQRVARVLEEVARGVRGAAPATVSLLSGDVHQSYLAEVDLGPPDPERSRLLQLVCSPIRNPLPRAVRVASAMSANGLAWPMGRLVARTAQVPDPPFRWSLTRGPWFDNALATLELDGRKAWVRWESARVADDDPAEPRMRRLHATRLR